MPVVAWKGRGASVTGLAAKLEVPAPRPHRSFPSPVEFGAVKTSPRGGRVLSTPTACRQTSLPTLPSAATSLGAAAAHASGNCLPERGTVQAYGTPSLNGPGPAPGEDLEKNLERRCPSKATPDVGRHGPVATSTQA